MGMNRFDLKGAESTSSGPLVDGRGGMFSFDPALACRGEKVVMIFLARIWPRKKASIMASSFSISRCCVAT